MRLRKEGIVANEIVVGLTQCPMGSLSRANLSIHWKQLLSPHIQWQKQFCSYHNRKPEKNMVFFSIWNCDYLRTQYLQRLTQSAK